MTSEQFDAISKLIRSRGPTSTAARMVLIDGISNSDAAREINLSPQSVSNTVSRFKLADKILASVYKDN